MLKYGVYTCKQVDSHSHNHPDTLPQYSKSDYPHIHYWSRSEWLNFRNKKDSSILGSEASP